MSIELEEGTEDIGELFLRLVEGCPVEDGMTLEEHDKHYHHGHFDPETMTCNVRERLSSRKEEDDYYQKLSQGVTFDAAEKWLRDKKYADCCHVEKLSDLKDKFGFSNVDYSELELNGKPLPQEVFEKDVIAMMAVCRDLESRFPGFKLPYPKLIAWDQTNQENGDVFYSTSSLDKRDVTRTCYVALGDFFSGRGADQPMYHILRHEIGHLLATESISRRWLSLVKEFKTPSEYRAFAKDNISSYAAFHPEEAIAEAFAIYASSRYRKGTLPQKVVEFVRNMINEGEREKGVAMDETTSVERAGLEPIDGCYYQSRDTFSMPKGHGIQWLDNKCGFVKFNTYEEKFRYALGRYKVPQDWIDRFVAEFPGRKWDDTEIYLIQSDYRNSVKPIDEVIDFYKGWLS